MQHSFDTEIAAKYGIVEAILLNNFAFWLVKKKANNQDLHDGRYWTYNSIKAFKALFPYLTDNQLRRALNKLVEENLVVTGNYNQKAYDRTLWYALTDEAMEILKVDLHAPDGENHKSICEKTQMDFGKNTNAIVQNYEPIPDINTDINTDINSSSSGCNNTTTEQKNKATAAATAKNAIAFWMNNTGQFGEVIRSDISDLTEQYGEAVVTEAMREAIRSNVRNIKYVTAIVERMASGKERTAKDEPVGNAWSAAFEKLYGGGVENGNNHGEECS